MKEEILMAGAGGQGIVFASTLLAYAAMREGKEVTFFKSYGIEMRGGTANCSVIISSEEIASPIISSPQIGIFLNPTSLEKFLPRIKKNGLVIFNSSLGKKTAGSFRGKFISVPASSLAEKIGHLKVANMIMLGVYLQLTKTVSLKSCLDSLKEVVSSKGQELLKVNEEALKQGFFFQ